MTNKKLPAEDGQAAVKRFSIKMRVYWSDCDAAGIAYFPRFFRFFEIAEEELFVSLGRPRRELFSSLQIALPRAEVWARYRKPLREGDLIEVTAWIAERTASAFVYRFELRRDSESELAAEGQYRVVCVNRERFKPIPWPEEILELLKDYLPERTIRAGSVSDRT